MNLVKVRLRVFLLFLLFFLFSDSFVSAEELKIVFIGQAHAALYPCDCPLDRVGGLARRAAAIERLRGESEDVLVLEAGSSFAFGEEDLNKQDFDADQRRTTIYLDGLALMNYDAVLAGNKEFGLGLDFLKKHKGLPFVASNIKDFQKSYIIKDYGWIKVGVIGFSDVLGRHDLESRWTAPSSVLKKVIAELKRKGVNFIVLLSELNPKEDEELLKNNIGIDLVINGTHSLGSVALTAVGNAIYLKTWWQARRVGVLTLNFKDRQLQDKELYFLKLDQEFKEDEKILALLPACFQNGDCRPVPGSTVKCTDGGTEKAQCYYKQNSKVELMVIKPRFCHTCRMDDVVASLHRFFENLEVQYVVEDDKKAKEIIKEFGVKMLPAFVFNKSVAGLSQFDAIKPHMLEGKDHYLLKPSDSGVSYLLDRPKVSKRLDVFFDFSYNQAPELFRLLKSFKEKHKNYDVRLNFLVVRDKEGHFVSRGGESEIEEFRRVACIDKLYPGSLFDYLICRSSQKGLSWWGDCALEAGIDTMQVKECVFLEAGQAAFDEHIAVSNELEVLSGPTFIIENKEIFGIVNVPSLQEFEKTVIGVAQKKK